MLLHLFPALKQHLGDQTDDDVETAVKRWLKKQHTTSMNRGWKTHLTV
jgi:hypothetical protein